jgi:hypothetical protein
MPSGKDLVAGAGAGFCPVGAVRLTLAVAGRSGCFGFALGVVGEVTVTGGNVLELGAASGAPEALGSSGALLGGCESGGELDVSVDVPLGAS